MSNKELIDFIDEYRYLWSDSINNQLKDKKTLKIINDIIVKTNKQPSEAVLLFVSVVRYILNEEIDLDYLGKDNLFQDFIYNNKNKIIEISQKKNVQGNLPERGLPLLEIIGKRFSNETISLIELGASFGLIGQCLLNSKKILDNKEKYFNEDQQFPVNPNGINDYLGIEIDPPDKKWIFACLDNPNQKNKLSYFIDDIFTTSNFNIIKLSAIGFSNNEMVEKLINKSDCIIILTSFMLYQFERENQYLLKGEIKNVLNAHNNAYWINQAVDLNTNNLEKKYFIEINGRKVVYLSDDLCQNWYWI